MIYLIVPPLIFITGTAVLIAFLFKKISASPEGREILAAKEEPELKKAAAGAGRKFVEFFLKLLEKIVHEFKLYSLKFHNSAQKWFQMIKNKRDERSRKEAERKAREQQEKAKKSTAEPAPDRFPGMKTAEKEKTVPLPTISRTVVLPEVKAESKDRMEEALIERIASNPQDIEAYERLGDYYMEQGNYSESLECFRHVLKLSPVHRKARIRIRRMEKMLGK